MNNFVKSKLSFYRVVKLTLVRIKFVVWRSVICRFVYVKAVPYSYIFEEERQARQGKVRQGNPHIRHRVVVCLHRYPDKRVPCRGVVIVVRKSRLWMLRKVELRSVLLRSGTAPPARLHVVLHNLLTPTVALYVHNYVCTNTVHTADTYLGHSWT